MFYYLFYPLHTKVFAFNIFRYITFRAAYAGITALLISFIFGPKLIRFLKRHKFCAGIREEGLKNQKEKAGTPTMGGILILAAVIVSTLLWADFKESFIIISLLTVVSLGILGFYDDYKKTRKGKGVRGLYKIIWQILIGVSVGIWLYFFPKLPDFVTKTSLLFLKNTFIQLSYFYVPFVVLVLVGTS
ncbi:MAG TPA: phospho-N-acetylmuramoyl-pentapeptide-transferase, partial [bacterium (Candidatus Stahlbacteria)]|nr:phospho-N-acetylmuramoyl-pentapeptide-transferase [Candidatus Stahlbacteria bacterium]